MVTVVPTKLERDWGVWSQEAVRLMQERNDAWMRDVGEGRHYHWSMDDALFAFPSENGEVVADLCAIGSTSVFEGTFLWAWANEQIPSRARQGLERVREFGEINGLALLTTPQWPGGRSEGLEMAAVAGRILDAAGIWVATEKDVTLFFALSNFGSRPGRSPAG